MCKFLKYTVGIILQGRRGRLPRQLRRVAQDAMRGVPRGPAAHRGLVSEHPAQLSTR